MTTTTTPTALPDTAPRKDPTPPKKPKKVLTGKDRSVRTTKYVFLLIFGVLVLIPLYVMVVTSFKPAEEFSLSKSWLPPQTWSWYGWQQAWETLAPPLGRSLVLAVVASVVSSVLGSLNGFVFAKWQFPGANLIFSLFLFGMFIPYQAIMVPLQRLMLDLNDAGLPPGIPTLILAHVVYGIPICTLIFRNYYATAVPNEILEASKVDGAGLWRTYRSIILPISMPAFVVALIWQFTSAWNDFLFALFLSTPQTGPATFALNQLAGGQVPVYSIPMAGALITSLPTLLVYIFLGRYFISGLMSGSVK